MEAKEHDEKARPAEEEEVKEPTFFGKFIQTYSSFLSSFVIGVAGLIATSTYQCSQARVAHQQAEAQQKIAVTQAENNWKIERAKILSQNLQVLSTQGGGNVEQRYGVLLSLTRGNILDPELAVSYALELGKDSPEYMRSVLSNTTDKDYRRLAGAYVVTCDQRYGLAKAVELCKGDKLQERSISLAELISDETEAAIAAGKPGPLQLLRDEREAEAGMLRYLWLFTPFLHEMYERRQWSTIQRLEEVSAGARVISALSLLTVQNGDLVTSAERTQIEAFQRERREALKGYLLSPSCDVECKGRLAGILLSGLARSHDSYAEVLRALLRRPRAEQLAALNRLSKRLLYCQVDPDDLAVLRDRVLVPELQALLGAAKADGALIEDLVGLLSLSPEPEATAGAQEKDAFGKVQQLLQKAEGGRYQRVLLDRQVIRRRVGKSPPVAMRKATFCNAVDSEDTGGAEESE